MFQYAAGRALALSTNQALFVDVRDYASYALHNGYELDRVFNVPAEVATDEIVHDLLGWKASALVRRLLRRRALFWLRGNEYVVEPHFKYWPGILNVGTNCYLCGYWQSERYFQPFSDVIRKEFAFRSPVVGRNQDLAQQIAGCQAISLHIRRGDYVSDRKTSQLMEVCSDFYYRAAIRFIADRVEQPVFFIFSDDLVWAKQNLHLAAPHVFVEHNSGSESYRDMQLMSLCRHHIIANSSFSWWGAWLNPSTNKIVIAPKKWFAGPTDTSDLIPSGWCEL